MPNEFSTGKSVFILTIVAGCFAVLWPNIFYPMLMGSYSSKSTLSTTEGCCDVMFDSDMNAIKIMTQLCEKILNNEEDFDKRFLLSFEQGKLTKEIVETCQQTVLKKCGIDITEFLREKVRLGKSYKQILDGIRSLNSSICLKQNFGVSMGEIGLPRRIRVWGINKSKHLRQERPPHLRPEMMHPALREKGRAIPQSHGLHQPTSSPQPRPGPVPGLRPPMGGAGHVVPPPKGSGTMGIVMPMYTVGIVVFFLYTMMKLMFKKSDDSTTYEGFTPDPEFRRVVFDNSASRFANNKEVPEDSTKLVVTAISGLVQEVNRQIRQDQAQPLSQDKNTQSDSEPTKESDKPVLTEEIVKELENEKDEEELMVDESEGKGAVKVLGMEMTECCEGGAKWSRPSTPLSRPPTPQNIYLPGSLPSQSQLLVSDSRTETLSAQDNAVVLTGKVTLSLIGLIESDTKPGKHDEEKSEASQTTKSPQGNEKGDHFVDQNREQDGIKSSLVTPEIDGCKEDTCESPIEKDISLSENTVDAQVGNKVEDETLEKLTTKEEN